MKYLFLTLLFVFSGNTLANPSLYEDTMNEINNKKITLNKQKIEVTNNVISKKQATINDTERDNRILKCLYQTSVNLHVPINRILDQYQDGVSTFCK